MSLSVSVAPAILLPVGSRQTESTGNKIAGGTHWFKLEGQCRMALPH
jgi:hypothetical protein